MLSTRHSDGHLCPGSHGLGYNRSAWCVMQQGSRYSTFLYVELEDRRWRAFRAKSADLFYRQFEVQHNDMFSVLVVAAVRRPSLLIDL